MIMRLLSPTCGAARPIPWCFGFLIYVSMAFINTLHVCNSVVFTGFAIALSIGLSVHVWIERSMGKIYSKISKSKKLPIFLSSFERIHQCQTIDIIDISCIWESARESRYLYMTRYIITKVEGRGFSFKVWIGGNNDFFYTIQSF